MRPHRNAAAAFSMVDDALADWDLYAIGWTAPGVISVQPSDDADRLAIADRLGLGPAVVNDAGTLATHIGDWADIPVRVYGRPTPAEMVDWAQRRAVA